MATVDSLEIQITASATSADKALDRLVKNLGNFSSVLGKATGQAGTLGKTTPSNFNRLNRSMQSTTKSANSLAVAFGKFYANYFLVVRGIKSLWKSIEGTADYIEAFNYYNVAFGKISSEWNKDWEKFGYENAEAYANSFTERMSESLGKLSGIQIDLNKGLLSDTGMKNLGLNIQEITQYASQLASVTNSVGQTGEVSLAAANVFTKLGADMSSLFNQDYSGAMKNLQSGLIGQSRALYKYGIDITNATLQTYAYGLGIEKAVSEMTQAEKMQLRMIAILDQSKVAWGDLANTINSPSNMIRQFTNNLKETGMVLGQLFIPLLEKVLPIINGVTIAIKRLLVNIAGFLGIKIDFSSFGQGYSEDIDGVTDSFDDATAAAKKFKTTTLGIDELNINSPQNESGSGSSGGFDLTDEIMEAAAEYEKVWDEAFAKMESLAQAFADRISKILEPISEMFKNLFSGKFEDAGKNLSDFLMQMLDIDWDSVYEKARGFGTGLAQFLNGLINPELFKKVGQTVANSLNTAFNFLNSFGKEFDWANFGTSLADGVKGFFENWDAGLTAETLSTFANGILAAAKSAIDELGKNDTFEDIGQKLVDFICGIDWGGLSWNLANFFASMAKAIAEFPTDFARGIAEGILEKIFGQEIEIKLPKWLEDGLKYLFVGVTPHIALLSFLPSQEEFNDWFTNDVAPWFSEERWLSLFANIKNAFALKWAEIQEWWSGTAVYAWWTEGVQPLFSLETWYTLLQGIHDAFLLKWSELMAWWNETAIVTWWNEGVLPWFSLETWALLWDNIKEAFVMKWGEITKWWNETAIGKWWKESVEPWFAKKKWVELLKSIPEAFKSAFETAKTWVTEKMQAMYDFVCSVVDAIKSLISSIASAISSVASSIGSIVSGIGINVSVPAFATGGFPEDGFFFANHNELVGQFSNGKTAVANNEQIIAGIEAGVERAVSRVLAPYLADIAQNTRETADKESSLNIDGRELVSAINERTVRNGFAF